MDEAHVVGRRLGVVRRVHDQGRGLVVVAVGAGEVLAADHDADLLRRARPRGQQAVGRGQHPLGGDERAAAELTLGQIRRGLERQSRHPGLGPGLGATHDVEAAGRGVRRVGPAGYQHEQRPHHERRQHGTSATAPCHRSDRCGTHAASSAARGSAARDDREPRPVSASATVRRRPCRADRPVGAIRSADGRSDARPIGLVVTRVTRCSPPPFSTGDIGERERHPQCRKREGACEYFTTSSLNGVPPLTSSSIVAATF